MKQFVIFYTLCSFLLLSVTSCTDKEESIQQVVKPGTYYIGKDLSAMVPSTQTRGVSSSNYEFDSNYDLDYIYLHNINTGKYITIPIYSCSNDETSTCKGFHYKMVVDDSGDATIYPLQQDGETETGASLALGKNETCYFSSWKSDTWALEKDQISEQNWAEESESYFLFYRDKSVNTEIYRSGNGVDFKDFTISDLTVNGTLDITRACANFSLGAVFFDKNEILDTGDPDITYYNTTLGNFATIMGSEPSKWYIKIYIGGQCFPSSYNIATNQKAEGSVINGYYSSGDVGKFDTGEIVGKVYLAFTKKTFSQDFETFGGFGYLSDYKNTLLSPVTGSDQVSVYLLVKHWTGTTETPGDAWLNSDVGALQTVISQEGVVTKPQNSSSYKIRCAIDLNVLKTAWGDNGDAEQDALIDAAGIDPKTGEYKNSSLSATPTLAAYNTAITRSPSGAPVRTFTLPKDAIVIQEVY